MADATSLTKVLVQRGENSLTLVIQGDGAFRYNLFRLGDHRLVLDLPNVRPAIRFNELEVGHDILWRIRIGRHSGKTRMVLDLEPTRRRGVRYAAKSQGNQLAIQLVY